MEKDSGFNVDEKRDAHIYKNRFGSISINQLKNQLQISLLWKLLDVTTVSTTQGKYRKGPSE